MNSAERSTPSVASVDLRNDKINGRALGDGAGPLRVDVRLGLVSLDSRVGPIVDDVQRTLGRGHTEHIPESGPVGWIDVGFADDRDRLPGPVDRRGRIPQRRNVVDCGEVVWAESLRKDLPRMPQPLPA